MNQPSLIERFFGAATTFLLLHFTFYAVMWVFPSSIFSDFLKEKVVAIADLITLGALILLNILRTGQAHLLQKEQQRVKQAALIEAEWRDTWRSPTRNAIVVRSTDGIKLSEES